MMENIVIVVNLWYTHTVPELSISELSALTAAWLSEIIAMSAVGICMLRILSTGAYIAETYAWKKLKKKPKAPLK